MGFEKWFKDYLSRVDGTESLKSILRVAFMNGYELGKEDTVERVKLHGLKCSSYSDEKAKCQKCKGRP